MRAQPRVCYKPCHKPIVLLTGQPLLFPLTHFSCNIISCLYHQLLPAGHRIKTISLLLGAFRNFLFSLLDEVISANLLSHITERGFNFPQAILLTKVIKMIFFFF